MPRLGVHVGSGMVSAIVVSTIGAIILLVIVGFFGGGFARRRYWRF